MPAVDDPTALAPTPFERRWRELVPPEVLDSARALYELMPRQRGGQLPFVDVPYNPRSEAHWADAARIADYAAHVPAGASRVLDVGPGDGWPSLPVAAARPEVCVVGVDPSPRRAARCTSNASQLGLANARFLAGDAAALPFASGAFDAVMAAHSLEEAAEPHAVLAELARVLRPGGTLRVSYQDWRLAAAEVETVLLWDGDRGDGADPRSGERVLLYTYVRRVQSPALERRYTLVLPADGAAEAHAAALVASAAAPRAYGESLLTREVAPALGVPLLERLAPHALRSTVVEMRRWTTAWLVEALRDAGFADVRSTVHPGDLARHVARDLIASGATEAAAPAFEALTGALGRAAGRHGGDEMVVAVR